MRVYAPSPGFRLRQVLTDIGMAAWVLLFVWLGRLVHRLVIGLAAPGEALERAGGRLGRGAAQGGEAAGDVPLLGEALSRPFDAIADAGTSLAAAGVAQQEGVATLALVLSLIVGGLPVLWLAARWLPWRIRWMVEACAVTRLLDEEAGAALLAHRALAGRRIAQLRRAESDPWRAFTEGRHGRLATLELDALGLRLPAPEEAGPPATG
jgi:hypothetical protein